MPPDESYNTEEFKSLTKSIELGSSKKNALPRSMFASVSPSNYFRAIERERKKRVDSSCRTPSDSTAFLKKPIEDSGLQKLP